MWRSCLDLETDFLLEVSTHTLPAEAHTKRSPGEVRTHPGSAQNHSPHGMIPRNVSRGCFGIELNSLTDKLSRFTWVKFMRLFKHKAIISKFESLLFYTTSLSSIYLFNRLRPFVWSYLFTIVYMRSHDVLPPPGGWLVIDTKNNGYWWKSLMEIWWYFSVWVTDAESVYLAICFLFGIFFYGNTAFKARWQHKMINVTRRHRLCQVNPVIDQLLQIVLMYNLFITYSLIYWFCDMLSPLLY